MTSVLAGFAGCSKTDSNEPPPLPGPAGRPGVAGGGAGGFSFGGTGGSGANAGTELIFGGRTACMPETCAEKGYACGSFISKCGTPVECATEGLACGALEACVGGKDDMPAKCVTSFGPCDVCSKIPDCTVQGTPTRITGRVITPGRTDADTGNQVGIPNAVVYIMRNNDVADLTPIAVGIPAGGMSCERCEEQDLGPTLLGTVTDATGRFALEGSIPVGAEFLLAVKVGRFRRVVKYTLPESAACTTTALPATLPDNPTRLARKMDDGLAVNIPRIAVTTGAVDAMECVLEKMGIDHTEFGNPAPAGPAVPHIQLYRGLGQAMGGPGMAKPPAGAVINAMTPPDTAIYGDLATLMSYDLLISDCEGMGWDSAGEERMASGANIREYVNRGGRMFSSHLSFSWLNANGTDAYDATNPVATGLGPAATWSTMADGSNNGTGVVSVGRPGASPRIQNFADWMSAEGVIAPPMNSFAIKEPRSQNTGIGQSSEEFVYREDGNARIQQFSFNTPYGAPEDQVCGRVAYSGFHVSGSGMGTMTTPFAEAVFPAHCTGALTAEEKVLLYMIFDLGACIGETPPPPNCTPETCESTEALCGFISDGCGKVVNCGPCPPPR